MLVKRLKVFQVQNLSYCLGVWSCWWSWHIHWPSQRHMRQPKVQYALCLNSRTKSPSVKSGKVADTIVLEYTKSSNYKYGHVDETCSFYVRMQCPFYACKLQRNFYGGELLSESCQVQCSEIYLIVLAWRHQQLQCLHAIKYSQRLRALHFTAPECTIHIGQFSRGHFHFLTFPNLKHVYEVKTNFPHFILRFHVQLQPTTLVLVDQPLHSLTQY